MRILFVSRLFLDSSAFDVWLIIWIFFTVHYLVCFSFKITQNGTDTSYMTMLYCCDKVFMFRISSAYLPPVCREIQPPIRGINCLLIYILTSLLAT